MTHTDQDLPALLAQRCLGSPHGPPQKKYVSTVAVVFPLENRTLHLWQIRVALPLLVQFSTGLKCMDMHGPAGEPVDAI